MIELTVGICKSSDASLEKKLGKLEGVDLRALRQQVDRLSKRIEFEFDRRDAAMAELQRLGQEIENG